MGSQIWPANACYIYILVVVCIVGQQKIYRPHNTDTLLALAPVIARQWTDGEFLRDRVAVKTSSVTSINSSRLVGTKKKERCPLLPRNVVTYPLENFVLLDIEEP